MKAASYHGGAGLKVHVAKEALAWLTQRFIGPCKLALVTTDVNTALETSRVHYTSGLMEQQCTVTSGLLTAINSKFVHCCPKISRCQNFLIHEQLLHKLFVQRSVESLGTTRVKSSEATAMAVHTHIQTLVVRLSRNNECDQWEDTDL